MKTKSLRYLVRAFAASGAARLVCQVANLSTAITRADVSALRADTDRACVLDLESPVGRGFEIIHDTK